MERIGKYELREVLGRGGMGVVYRAYDPLMDREVAIKVILEKALDSSETKARFVREARTAGRLSHENIMVIHDLGEVEGKTYIVMEFLQGKDLRSIIDNKEPLTLRDKLNCARQVCRGLQYAHANLIVHRDIKPENIKVLRDGRVKIMDFGIAKPYTPQGEIDNEQALTRVGVRVGTPWYMSPEQVKGGRVDKRTDIFSFGVVLYELLTYQKPFEGDYTTVMYKILHEEPKPIHIEESGLDAELQRILSKCLAKDHETRYADCLLILRDLDAIPSRLGDEKTVEELIKQGEELAAQDRLGEATTIFEEVLDIDPANQQARTILEKLTLQERDASTQRVLTGKIIGENISHFRIIEQIGAGGMGVVYKAEDVTLKRTVALKFLPPEFTKDETAKKRFMKEAQAASVLDHPNICAIHEISETDDGVIFICMTYYVGDNLASKIVKGPIDVRNAVEIAQGIARGLAEAHQHGIVHRDIKPANILITREGEVKIVDFGLAKLSGGTRITKIGSAMGTLPYMSPEQIKGLDMDQRTDIWSLGVLLYQALSGSLPFWADYEAALQHAIVNDEPTPLAQVCPGLPSGLEALIMKTLRKDVAERYGSMNDVLEDLGVIHAELVRSTPVDLTRSAELTRLTDNGRVYLQRREYDEALSRFEAALRLSPSDSRILKLREECSNKIREAKRIDTLVGEAATLAGKGKLKEARERVQAALTLDPQHPAAKELLATLQHKTDRQEVIDKLLTDAAFYLRRGKFEEAAASYRKILEENPGHKEAARGLKKVGKDKEHATNRERARTPVPSTPSRRRGVMVVGVTFVAVGLLGGGVWFFLLSPRPPEKTPQQQAVTDSSFIIAEPREMMLTQKALAVGADAGRWATMLFDSARHVEAKGEREASARNFTSARREFEDAKVLFSHAAEEAKRSETASTASLSELNALVTKVKGEMTEGRTAAERAGGKAAAPVLFREALTQERKGDSAMQSGTREGQFAARAAYTLARDDYRKALQEANNLADLRQDAEGRRGEMSLAKQSVTGTDQEKKASATYHKAADAEGRGQRLYQSGDYQGARDSYLQAGKLYADAGTEIKASHVSAAAPVETKPPPAEPVDAGKKDPAVKAREEREAANREIQRMLNSYKEYVEQGNLQGLIALLHINQEGQNRWEDFFHGSEQRDVTIEEVQSDVGRDNDNARVSFRVKMSYVDKLDNTMKTLPPNARVWTLEAKNGAWKVVTQK